MAEQTNSARRSFFAGLGLIAASGIVARLPPSTAVEALIDQPTEPQGKSYRLSEHVKKYYRTTTI